MPPSRTDAGTGSSGICRVIDAALSPVGSRASSRHRSGLSAGAKAGAPGCGIPSKRSTASRLACRKRQQASAVHAMPFQGRAPLDDFSSSLSCSLPSSSTSCRRDEGKDEELQKMILPSMILPAGIQGPSLRWQNDDGQNDFLSHFTRSEVRRLVRLLGSNRTPLALSVEQGATLAFRGRIGSRMGAAVSIPSKVILLSFSSSESGAGACRSRSASKRNAAGQSSGAFQSGMPPVSSCFL